MNPFLAALQRMPRPGQTMTSMGGAGTSPLGGPPQITPLQTPPPSGMASPDMGGYAPQGPPMEMPYKAPADPNNPGFGAQFLAALQETMGRLGRSNRGTGAGESVNYRSL